VDKGGSQHEDAAVATATASASASEAPSAPLAPPVAPARGSFFRQFCRTDTLLLFSFAALFNLKGSFYITTLADQQAAEFPADVARGLADTFNWAFPVGGFLTSICAACLLHRLASREDLYMGVSMCVALAFCLLSLGVPGSPPGVRYLGIAFFGPARTLQWACYFHLLGQPGRYSTEFNGRMIGYGNLIIAFVGNVPPYALNAFVSDSAWLGSESNRYFAVHVGLLLGVVACIPLPVHLYKTRWGTG